MRSKNGTGCDTIISRDGQRVHGRKKTRYDVAQIFRFFTLSSYVDVFSCKVCILEINDKSDAAVARDGKAKIALHIG